MTKILKRADTVGIEIMNKEVTVGREDCWCGFIEVPEGHKVWYNYNMFERLRNENQLMFKSYLLAV